MNELYFIRIILGALEQPNPSKALEEAFARIVALGQEEQYREGYANFQAFMHHTVRHDERQSVRRMTPFDEDQLSAALDLAAVDPTPPTRRVFIMERDGQPFGRFEFEPGQESAPLEALTPGRHVLRLPNGRVVWEKTLEPDAVLIGESDTWLEMAAATCEQEAAPSVLAPLLDGQMILKIYPGVRGGHAVISEWR